MLSVVITVSFMVPYV